MKPAALKRTAAEQKARDKGSKVDGASGDDYGWGTSLQLDHGHLAKMGVKQLPAAGSTVKIHGHARVTSASANDSGTGPQRSLSLQVTHLGMEAPAGPRKVTRVEKALPPAVAKLKKV